MSALADQKQTVVQAVRSPRFETVAQRPMSVLADQKLMVVLVAQRLKVVLVDRSPVAVLGVAVSDRRLSDLVAVVVVQRLAGRKLWAELACQMPTAGMAGRKMRLVRAVQKQKVAQAG